ncbi:hypothetical protein UC34_02000 [Pandoraea vervacti]|uniref:Copper resistance protein B n=1 Tax=Pandoraea vervacti TaxID=656178 RepID=A0ABM5SUK6_9BURK|nr:hypothetical protein [Pandoraea vervacti]AJP56095.1 hypothetical protein UC34_02000 [Pandoraea vervacti]
MMFLLLRRHAWRVPVALTLWGAGSVTATGAESAAPPVVIRDPASPNAPTGPMPASVLGDFTPPALSVATDDWRTVNASVSGNAGMPGGRHDMPHQGSSRASAPTGHAAHGMSSAPAPMDHGAMGHTMPMAPAPGATPSAPPHHEAMGHTTPLAPAPGSTGSAPLHDATGDVVPPTPTPSTHGGHIPQGDSQ